MRKITDITIRLSISYLLLYAPLTWLFGGDSVAAKMFYLQSDRGLTLVVLMTLTSAVIWFDVLLNSIIESKNGWPWAKKRRGFFYMSGAFLSWSVLFHVGKYVGLSFGAMYFYGFLSVLCATMAIIDAIAHKPCAYPELERRKFRR